MGVDVSYNCDCCGGGCCRDKEILCRDCFDDRQQALDGKADLEQEIADFEEKVAELEDRIEELENAD